MEKWKIKWCINAAPLWDLSSRLKVRIFPFKFLCILPARLIFSKSLPLNQVLNCSTISPLHNPSSQDLDWQSGLTGISALQPGWNVRQSRQCAHRGLKLIHMDCRMDFSWVRQLKFVCHWPNFVKHLERTKVLGFQFHPCPRLQSLHTHLSVGLQLQPNPISNLEDLGRPSFISQLFHSFLCLL